jgi:hypothetical protein
MIRRLLLISMAALATAAAAAAGTSSGRAGASSQCIAVQARLGPSAFASEFGSFGACVSALTPLARQNAISAATLCQAERANAGFAKTHGGKTFARFYGIGHKLKNAYASCLAAKERSASLTTVAAAAACRAAQANAAFAATHGGKTFAQYWATQHWGASAFANCLAQKAGPFLTVDPVQPAQEPQQPTTAKAGTVAAPCGPVEAGGLPRPLVCD